MEIQFRNVKFENEVELNYIAEMDSKIPLEYDSKYIWSEKAISLKVEQ